MGLNDAFSNLKAHILLMDPLPPVTRTYSLALQEEAHRMLQVQSTPSPNTMALHSSSRDSFNTPPSKNQDSRGNRTKDRCTYCNIIGHTKDACYKLHGYPPNYKPWKLRSSHRPNDNNNKLALNTATSPPSLTQEQ
uniref:Uncharacterized protein n=1 Tax=Nelumbo nucifera TaxID=4432 RepID=A0A822YG02_NELNU|nr:TPA_asm: hypothetical protein HUJ06_031373 [Nelumbo nucifera]